MGGKEGVNEAEYPFYRLFFFFNSEKRHVNQALSAPLRHRDRALIVTVNCGQQSLQSRQL